jgi:hypothetical protein
MACSSCGARKGHLDGCPEAPGSKRGGKEPPREREKDRGGRGSMRTSLCMATDGDEHIKEHRGIRHICAEKKNHGGRHHCSGCGHSW